MKNYILRIWRGDASGPPSETIENLVGDPDSIGSIAEAKVRSLGFDPDKDDYTLAEHEVSKPSWRGRL